MAIAARRENILGKTAATSPAITANRPSQQGWATRLHWVIAEKGKQLSATIQ